MVLGKIMLKDINTNTLKGVQAQTAIALGSNLGESLITLENALQILAETPGITLTSRSSWYRTEPVGLPQPDYLNGCALLKVELNPQELLEILLATERKFKRVRKERWGARILDLDIILYDDLVLDTPSLQVPHPRMQERAFVLMPLAEIAPSLLEPVSGKTITQLLKELDCSGVTEKLESVKQ